MPKLIPSTDHKGITYPTQKDMCDAYGVAQSLYKKRIERGWSKEEALEGKKPYYEADGKKYWTLKDTCDAFDITPNAFRANLKKGYTKDEIVKKEFLKKTIGPDNEKFFSEDEMCESYGVKKSTYRRRMEKTGDQKYALTRGDQRKRENRNRTITYGDVEITLTPNDSVEDTKERLNRLQAYADKITKAKEAKKNDG